jgi:hypothetical protein
VPLLECAWDLRQRTRVWRVPCFETQNERMALLRSSARVAAGGRRAASGCPARPAMRTRSGCRWCQVYDRRTPTLLRLHRSTTVCHPRPQRAAKLPPSRVAVVQSRPAASEPRGDLVWGILRASDGRLKQIARRETGLGEAREVCATASRESSGAAAARRRHGAAQMHRVIANARTFARSCSHLSPMERFSVAAARLAG